MLKNRLECVVYFVNLESHKIKMNNDNPDKYEGELLNLYKSTLIE